MEELRQQIRMLQAVGYNAVGDEDDEDGEEGRNGSGVDGGSAGGGTPGGLTSTSKGGKGGIRIVAGAGTMEAALLQKNRHLEHELTMSRLKGVDTKAELDAALARLNDLEAQVGDFNRGVSRGHVRNRLWQLIYLHP